jgi:hypothetical protein
LILIGNVTSVKREHIERSGIEIIHEVSSLIIIFALIAKRMGIQNTH